MSGTMTLAISLDLTNGLPMYELVADDSFRDCENVFEDWDAVNRYAKRKRDWHTNKGKRRIKDGYKERYV